MLKQDFIKKLDALKLDKSKYCVISGGVLVLYGIKDATEDIDIKMKPSYFEELKEKFDFKKSPKIEYEDLYELGDGIEVAVRDYDDKDVRIVDDCPAESLELTLAWWVEHNRPKDQEKIKLVREYLAKQL